MKKLLIVGLSVAMGTALALGITACGKKGNSDADTAKEAIKTVTNLHASVGTETPTSYKVTGATRVGTQVVTVEWSVTSTYEGYANYVSVGEKGADQQVAINITQHEEDAIDYTLTASVTVGKATETKDFSHTIPAGGKIYTPSEAKTLAGTLDADAYYMEEGVVTAINVKGYVVAIEGGWNTQYNELQKVYIGDTAETAKTDALYVYYIDSDPVYMTKEFDVEVGDLITVRGALQNYKGNTPELTYNGTGESRIDPVIVAPIQKAPKTDAQILDDAKNALKINEYYSATGDYDLPVPIKDVTATWALEGGNNEYVKVEDGKLTVLKLPDTETSYKLTATLSYGTATPVKAEFTIKLGKLALTHAGTEADPFTPAEALTIAATLADKQYYSDTNGVKAVYVKGKVVDVGTWSGGNYNNYNKVYIIAEDAYTATATKDTTGAILVYRIASDPQLTEGTLKHGDTLLLLCGIQRYGETYELGSTKGSSDSSNSATLVTYTPGVDERTAQQKVDAALQALAATFTVTKTGETELPASTVTGVTFAWSTEDKTYTITGNKIKVDALPTADATVTATVTATCGTETVTNNTKTVTITIRAQGTTPGESATLDFGVQANRTVFTAEQQVWTANGITLTNDKADSTTDITNNTSTEHIRLYNSSKVKIEYTSAIAQIVFHSCAAINTSNYPENVKTNFEALGGTTVTVSGDDVTVVFATPTTSIELTVSSQMRLLSMDVSAQAGPVAPKTDAEKVADAKAALKLSKTSLDAVGAEVELPATQGEASVTYELKDTTDLVKIENGKLVVLKLPEADTEITITATLTVGEEDDTVELKVTIVAPEPEITGELLYTLTTVTEQGSNNSYVGNGDIEVGGVTWNLEGNGNINPWRLGGNNTNCVAVDRKLTSKQTFGGTVQSLAITFGTATVTVNSVTFNVFTSDPTAEGATPSFTKTVKFKASGTVNVAAPTAGWKDCYYQLVFNLTATSSSNQYVQISKIEFYGEQPAHVHQYTYTHDTDAWTHTGTCSVPGCDKPTITEKCSPKLNYCEDCKHTYSAQEIVTQLYTLSSGQTMPGTYSLQGEVTKIDTAYSSQYGNVTFTITVEGKTVQCYREKSDYSSTVKVGDVVTVEGVLTCYGSSATKEFNANCKIVALEAGVAAAAASVAPVAILPGKEF